MLSAQGVAVRDYGTGNILASNVSSSGVVTWTNEGGNLPNSSYANFGQTGDFNGDGSNDLLNEGPSNSLVVTLNSGSRSFGTPTVWGSIPSSSNSNGFLIGHFYGTSRDDLAWLVPTMSGGYAVDTMQSTGSSFGPVVTSSLSIPGTISNVHLLDANGDGKEDIFLEQTYNGNTNWVILASSGGGQFSTYATSPIFNGTAPPQGTYNGIGAILVGNFIGGAGQQVAIEYVNGPNIKQFGVTPDNGDFYVWNGAWSGPIASVQEMTVDPHNQYNYINNGLQNFRVADFNGDGLSDIMFRQNTGEVDIETLGHSTWATKYALPGTVTLGVQSINNTPNGDNGVAITGGAGVFVGDMNGDGKSDIMWMIEGTGSNTRDVVFSQNTTVGGVLSFAAPSYQANSLPATRAELWFNQFTWRNADDDFGNW